MERTVYLEGGKVDAHQEHPLQYANLHTFPFSYFEGVSSRLERIQRDFLWGDGKLKKKPHLVKWTTSYLSKEKGGLSIHNLSTLNNALLVK